MVFVGVMAGTVPADFAKVMDCAGGVILYRG